MANTAQWINDADKQFEGDVLAAWQEVVAAHEVFEGTVRKALIEHDVQFSYKRGGVSLGLSERKAAKPTLAQFVKSHPQLIRKA